MRAPTAPVKAPRSWPNISDSSRSGGIAPQLTAMKGWFVRLLWAWMKRAISSLPVPLSPMISTVESVAATRCEMFRIFSITGWVPLIVKFSMRRPSPLPPDLVSGEKITPGRGAHNRKCWSLSENRRRRAGISARGCGTRCWGKGQGQDSNCCRDTACRVQAGVVADSRSDTACRVPTAIRASDWACRVTAGRGRGRHPRS